MVPAEECIGYVLRLFESKIEPHGLDDDADRYVACVHLDSRLNSPENIVLFVSTMTFYPNARYNIRASNL